MPLQIKELYIKVTINSEGEQEVSSDGVNPSPEGGGSQSMNKKDIISDCVEQVIEILKEKMQP